ncbi:MAG: Gfo/Idh/MocA family oxidoreductase, partial [Armatimonadetes bacterium]|nr:Gfo/Idh/MocA family oxidoreductase [Armatimonadota bacterium]
MSDQVSLAIIGCGGIAGGHLNGYQQLQEKGYSRFRIAALCDTSDERLGQYAANVDEKLGYMPEKYDSVEGLLAAAQVDAADICLPHAYHHTVAVPCLQAGLDCMVEKPLGITVKAGRQIIEAAEQNSRILATAEQVRRDIGARTMHWALVEAGVIGQPLFFGFDVKTWMDLDLESYAWRWRHSKLLTGGGMIFDAGAHFADMMLHLFGDIDEVTCTLKTFDTPIVDMPGLGEHPRDVEDYWVVTLKFASGLFGHWSYSRAARAHHINSSYVWGEKGAVKDRQEWMHPFQFGGDVELEDGTEIPYEELERQYLDQLSGEERERTFPYGITGGMT